MKAFAPIAIVIALLAAVPLMLMLLSAVPATAFDPRRIASIGMFAIGTSAGAGMVD